MRYRLALITAAALFSTGGAVIKLATLTPWQIASFRSAVAAAVLLLILPETRRWSWRLMPAAAAYAATLILFVISTRSTTAANAIFLQATAPLYLLFLGPLVLREPIRKTDIVFVAAVAFGMALFFVGVQADTVTAPRPQLGNLTAAASGLTWALTVTGLRQVARQQGPDRTLATVAVGNVVAFLATLPPALRGAVHLSDAGLSDAGVVLYLGIGQIGIAYIFLSRAIRHVSAFEVAAVLLLEPVLNPVWAWLVHGEVPGPGALIGGAIILSATAVNTWLQNR